MKKWADLTFPNDKVFTRFGSRSDLRQALWEFCRKRSDCADIITSCEATEPPQPKHTINTGGVLGLASLRIHMPSRCVELKSEMLTNRADEISRTVLLDRKATLLVATWYARLSSETVLNFPGISIVRLASTANQREVTSQ